MEHQVSDALLKAGVELGVLAVKGTTTLVNSKIQSIKDERSAEKLRNTYDEIINELLSEREQAIRIAQAYKEEYEKVNINDEDIEYLHKTLTQIKFLLNFQNKCDLVVACWGNHGSFMNRSSDIKELFNQIKCFGTNQTGQPKHPLYLKKDVQLIPYNF